MAGDGQPAEKTTRWGVVLGWVGGATAVIGLFGSMAGGAGWLKDHLRGSAELKSQMAVAKGMASQGDYEAAVKSYDEILKGDRMNKAALDGQLDATMLWVEDFSVAGNDDAKVANSAKAGLDEIIPLLDAGLVRAMAEKPGGERAADVEAHLGWAHWLNQKMAEREFGDVAERDWRKALAIDPKNVYANAMLGNWLLQTGGDVAEAGRHFDAALATGRVRAYVFEMETHGLIYNDMPGARALIIKTANAMRKAGEPLDEGTRQRLWSSCCLVYDVNQAELVDALSGASPDDAWLTYLWLDDDKGKTRDAESHARDHDFVQATLLEMGGKRADALSRFQALDHEMANGSSSFAQAVHDSVKRLSVR